MISYAYEVIKLWELDPEPVLHSLSPGLWPFAPLMRGDPFDLLTRSKRKILSVPESSELPVRVHESDVAAG